METWVCRRFSGKGGFDIVIGNPPYVGEGKKKIYLFQFKIAVLEDDYIGKMDFLYFFTSIGIEIFKETRNIKFIAPNNWMTTFGGKKMRKSYN